MATPIAHPKVMTIQPEFSALEFLSNTPATTPSPRMIRIIVPINSPIYACIDHSLLERPSGRHVARRGQVGFHLVVELHKGRAAHAVDHHGHLGAREVDGVTEDPGQHFIDDLVRWLDVLALDARLAVDAHADLHLILADVEDGLPTLWRGAARERHPHRAHVGVDALRKLLDACEIFPVVGRCAADLVHEDGACDAAPPAGVRRVLDGHIIVGHDIVGLDPFGLAELPCHLEVEYVARVVLDDVEDPGPAVHGLASLQHLVRRRAREYGTGTSGVEHTGAHETAVGRLVSRATSGDQGYLAL